MQLSSLNNMKSEDITAIATSVLAVTVLLGTILYFQQEREKKNLKKEWMEQRQDNIKKGIPNLEVIKIKKAKYKKWRQDVSKCRSKFVGDEEGYLVCMTKKGYSEMWQ